MKKSDFVLALANKADISHAKANEYLNAMLEIITDALKAGDKVTLTGFGTFEVRDRAARMVTDIRSKEKKQTPATKYPAFSAGAVLKEAVRPSAAKAAQAAGKSDSSPVVKSTPAKSAPARKTPSKAVAKPAAMKATKTPTKKSATTAKSK